ncbi:MAG: LexA family transcriptional regulator [Spirosomaceae bacterium]|jgi:transcriptional regulator with XRE-family HTH domain|nr:LexA family transcriptional regulator [Spirosomataceae bacterium]
MATYFGQNLAYLRRALAGKISQQRLADELGLKKSTLAAYELGNAEPNYEDLVFLAGHFRISIDDLLNVDLARQMAFGTPNGNIEYVPVKALGGYTAGYGDAEYIEQLPTFELPFLSKEKKYRAFPYEGDSMPPLREGCVVFGEWVENWKEIKNGTICLVVTRDEGVVLKKVFNYLSEKGLLVLKSLNERYAPYPVLAEDILELWQFAGYFDGEFPR